jgi:hypothetical protein
MRYLIGQSFPLADRVYRIVDVRQVAGDAMIYAEPVVEATDVAPARTGQLPPAGPARAARAAFHYRDIAAHLPARRRS